MLRTLELQAVAGLCRQNAVAAGGPGADGARPVGWADPGWVTSSFLKSLLYLESQWPIIRSNFQGIMGYFGVEWLSFWATWLSRYLILTLNLLVCPKCCVC